jgi:hypothetical protein
MHHSSGRGWCCVGRAMPCRAEYGAAREEARVHGNVIPALGTLGGSVVLGRHGH